MITDQINQISTISLESPASVRKSLPSVGKSGWLLPEYIVGPENDQLKFLFSPSTLADLASLSPIVLYGEGQVGKTALAITLAVEWSRIASKRPLSFTTGKTFSHDFAAAVEIDDSESFRVRHRDCQLLVVDDFESLISAPASQLELSNTLDQLIHDARPVIITSSRLPSAISLLSPALSSRLAGGYSLPLSKPSPPVIEEIVRQLCTALDRRIPVGEVVSICQQFTSTPLSANDLKTVVLIAQQNVAAAGSFNSRVVVELARQHFAIEAPTLSGIAKVVAKRMRVRLADMRASTREASIVRARGLAILLARELTDNSLQQIGLFFGGRDHSTILHACRKTLRMLDSDTDLANMLRDVRNDLHVGT